MGEQRTSRHPTRSPERPGPSARLAALLTAAAAGRFPPADGGVTILPQPTGRDAGVIAFTGHAVVFADADPAWIAAQLPRGELSAPLSAAFLHNLGDRLGRRSTSIDMLACARPLTCAQPLTSAQPPARKAPPAGEPASAGTPEPAGEPAPAGTPQPAGEPPRSPLSGPVLTELTARAGRQHPRVVRALRYRDEVRVWQANGAVLLIGRGLAGRFEVAIEVDEQCRGQGLGARLAVAARRLVPPGEPVWAQIAPGNAASVRAFLRAGFRPVGAEALLSAPGADGTMAE